MRNSALLAGLALSLALAQPVHAAASQADPCRPHSHTLAFFNGVWNTPDAALAAAKALHQTLAEGLAGDPAHPADAIAVEVFYNASGLQRGTRGGIDDLIEVFQQRSAELDEALRERWELFWETLEGRDDFWSTLGAAEPRARDVAAALKQARHAQLLARTAALAGAPPTQLDYAAHELRLRALQAEGRGVLMAAHSQGNFFLNRAFEQRSGKGGLAAVHIAPAAMATRGPHLLSTNDLVIAALRAAVPGEPPPANIAIPYARREPSGHDLVETYLDGERNGRQETARLLAAQLRTLTAGSPTASPGLFSATLTWNGPGDLDLHVFEPDGTHVYYDARTGHSGKLDIDDTSGWGPEHYYATCAAALLQEGTYRIGLNHYALATGSTATLQIASAERGVLRTLTLAPGPERQAAGDKTPVEAARVSVRRGSGASWSVAMP